MPSNFRYKIFGELVGTARNCVKIIEASCGVVRINEGILKLNYLPKSSRSGFTAMELVVSLAVSVVLIGGFIFAFNRYARLQSVEVIKSELLNRHSQAKARISDDLKGALSITGNTGQPNGIRQYYAVSRAAAEVPGKKVSVPLGAPITLTNIDAFDAAEVYDGIMIYKQVFPEISGVVVVRPTNAGDPASVPTYLHKFSSLNYSLKASGSDPNSYINKPSFWVYYLTEGGATPTDKDKFFQTAFKEKQYFFISKPEYRNIVENFSFRGDFTPFSCDHIATGRYCMRIEVGFRNTSGFRISNVGGVVDPRVEMSGLGGLADLQVGEKIIYSVGGGSCPAKSLCRTVDDIPSSTKVILSNLAKMETRYSFENVPADSAIVLPFDSCSAIRHPRDPCYWNNDLGSDDAARAANAINFQYASELKVFFNEELPIELSNSIGKSNTAGAFIYDNGTYRYASDVRFRPGIGFYGQNLGIVAGEFLNSDCTPLEKAKCNPSGKCNDIFYITNDINSPLSEIFKYDVNHPSALCQCGWSEADQRFYDPRDTTFKFPYLNQATFNMWGVAGENRLISATRANACAKFTGCSDSNNSQLKRNPLCKINNYCIHGSSKADFFTTTSGFNTSNLDLWASLTENPPSIVQRTLRSKLLCNNNYFHLCDDAYHLYKNVAPSSTTVRAVWDDFCACTVREFSAYDSNGTPTTAAVVLPDKPANTHWDAICGLQPVINGNPKYCPNTLDASAVPPVYLLQSSVNDQGLTLQLAQLCGCLKNAKATIDPSQVRTPPFGDAAAGISTPYSVNLNQVRAGQFGTNEIGPVTGTWLRSTDSRLGLDIFDFRADNPSKTVAMTTAAQNKNPYNVAGAPSFPSPMPTPSYSSTWEGDTVCGWQSHGNPKCLSYKTQYAHINTSLAGVLNSYDVNCGLVQNQYVGGWDNLDSWLVPGSNPGACLEESYPINALPGGSFQDYFINSLNNSKQNQFRNSTWWKYRFFCDPKCGATGKSYTDFEQSNFWQEVYWIRREIRHLVGDFNNGDWCSCNYFCDWTGGGGGSSGGGTPPPIPGGDCTALGGCGGP